MHFIVEAFTEAGIDPGDPMLIHSSFRQLSRMGVRAEAFIGAFPNAIYPTFTYGWWTGEPWTPTTPSDTGVLGETCRWFHRSRHPFYSFASRNPDLLTTDLEDRTAFGDGTVFATIHHHDAWVVVVDLRYDQSFTFFHYVEHQEGGVPWRHTKTFQGLVDGQLEEWSMPVRNDDVVTWVEPMGELLHNVGAMRRLRIGDVEIKYGRAMDVYDTVALYMPVVPELLHATVTS